MQHARPRCDRLRRAPSQRSDRRGGERNSLEDPQIDLSFAKEATEQQDMRDALEAGVPLTAGGLAIRIADPDELRTTPKQTVA